MLTVGEDKTLPLLELVIWRHFNWRRIIHRTTSHFSRVYVMACLREERHGATLTSSITEKFVSTKRFTWRQIIKGLNDIKYNWLEKLCPNQTFYENCVPTKVFRYTWRQIQLAWKTLSQPNILWKLCSNHSFKISIAISRNISQFCFACDNLGCTAWCKTRSAMVPPSAMEISCINFPTPAFGIGWYVWLLFAHHDACEILSVSLCVTPG